VSECTSTSGLQLSAIRTTHINLTVGLPTWCYIAGLCSRSRRLGLETYQRLVSSREKLSTSRSREADVSVSAIYVSCPRQFPDEDADSAVRSVNGL